AADAELFHTERGAAYADDVASSLPVYLKTGRNRTTIRTRRLPEHTGRWRYMPLRTIVQAPCRQAYHWPRGGVDREHCGRKRRRQNHQATVLYCAPAAYFLALRHDESA